MPFGDGTGPIGKGPGTGRGQGMGRGIGKRHMGPVKNCVCPNCGIKIPHQRGVPCTTVKCPNCGTRMLSE
ncbi:MAG TPA: hypothetical protein PK303_02985 [bacterium]|nr:hypothetical protein [bacterium]HOL34518.1 hypothetical protein [bacterium]HPP08070.1 hypothetical protein [bacterium]